MLEVPSRRWPRARQEPGGAVLEYAALGWACCPGAYPLSKGSRACSCDRIGCPVAGAHPLSLAWQVQATTDAPVLRRWWREHPGAGVILPTGRVFDVFDVPAAAGTLALNRIAAEQLPVGPVATLGSRRHLFFVATRGTPDNEDEWWSSDLDVRSTPAGTRHIDSASESVDGAPGLRWHCRESYVVAPPSALPDGQEAAWLRHPTTAALPDPLVLLEVLADACEETAGDR